MKENIDLLALIGTDYILKINVNGSYIWLQKTNPRFRKTENGVDAGNWRVISNSKWHEDFYNSKSVVFKYVWAAYKDFCKKERVLVDNVGFIAWFLLLGSTVMEALMMDELSF